MSFSPDELRRYDRQIQISGFGKTGQLKLKKARVTVVGAGGLGCPASLYLVAAGIGTVLVVDQETVELSNLNRQILHWSSDIGRSKTHGVLHVLEGVKIARKLRLPEGIVNIIERHIGAGL